MDELIEAFTLETLCDPATLASLIEESIKRTTRIISAFPLPKPTEQIATVKKRERRLLDAYEEGLIDVEELRRRREALRRDVEKLTNVEKGEKKMPAFELEQFVRLVVRGALRLRACSELEGK